MLDKPIIARKGPQGRVALVIENDRGGIDAELIRPEQALDLARSLTEIASAMGPKAD
ncbi:MAG: hypothetical protein ISR47_09615 [Rhodospirillales bacterium]|nr:hypothetical protein [Rhodospirillales bacterium]